MVQRMEVFAQTLNAYFIVHRELKYFNGIR